MNVTWKEYINLILENVNIILVPQLYELVKDYTSLSSFYRYIGSLEKSDIIERQQMFKGCQTCYIKRKDKIILTNRRKYLGLLIMQYKIIKSGKPYGTVLDITQYDITAIYEKLEKVYPYIKHNAFYQLDKEYISSLIHFKKQSLLKKENSIIPKNTNKNINIYNLYNRGIFIVGCRENIIRFVVFDIYNRMNKEKLKKLIDYIFELLSLYGIKCNVDIEICMWNEAMKNKAVKLLTKNQSIKKENEKFSYRRFLENNNIRVTNLNIQKYFGNLYIHL